MELINNYSNTEGDYSYDITGYVKTSYINITAQEVDGYINNSDYLNINTDVSATVTSEAGDHGFTYKCHIDISGMFEIDFNLPNFLSVPGVNLTLFKKMDEFSKQLRDLNDNLINFIQSTGCCDMSYQYNKTMVPIFRYLADHPDVSGCNIEDPKVGPGDDCKRGGGSNFMSEILKVITQITKVYTAIEPIFCIIKPIPGNPWLPFDFNWIRPILPYIEKYSKFAEKIMSGELIDVIIDPVKDINRTLFNCKQSKSVQTLEKGITASTINNAISEIKNEQDFLEARKEFEKKVNDNRADALQSLSKYSDLPKVYAFLGDMIDQNEKDKEQEKALIARVQTDLDLIQDTFSLSKKEQEKIEAYSTAEKNQPLQCLQELFKFRPELPKLPWTEISLLPTGDTRLRNDLTKVIGETAFAIKYKDIYGDNKEFTNAPQIMDKNITFDEDAVYNADFVSKFREYMKKDGQNVSYKKILPNDFNFYLDDATLKTSSFDTSALDNASDFFTNKSTLEGVMDRDISAFDSTMFSTVTGDTDTVLDNNNKIANFIQRLQEKESSVVKELNKAITEDKLNWEKAKAKSQIVLDKIIKDYKKRINKPIEDAFSYLSTQLIDISVEEAQEAHWNCFGKYLEIDIINDPFDKTSTDGYEFLESVDGEVAQQQSIINGYIRQRKILLGGFAQKYFNKQFEFLKEEFDTCTNAANTIKNGVIQLLSQKISQIETGGVIKVVTDSEYDAADNTDLLYRISDIRFDILDSFEGTPYESTVTDIKEAQEIIVDNIVFNKYIKRIEKYVSVIGPGLYFPIADENDNILNVYDLGTVISTMYDKLLSIITFPDASDSDSNDTNIEGLLLRTFKYEAIKKTLFTTIDDNVAYTFYVTFTPEITIGCNIICELIQFIVNYLLAAIKKILKTLIFWLIDYLIPDWLKNIIRLILYKLKCFLMIAYMPERLSKIDDTYDSFMESIKNRIALYPYDACAKKAIDNALANEAAELPDTEENEDTIIDVASTHVLVAEFVDEKLNTVRSISKYNYQNIKIRFKKDQLATLNNVVLKDLDDDLSGASAINLTEMVQNFDPTDEVDYDKHFYIISLNNGDLLINNLDLTLLRTESCIIQAESFKSTATQQNLNASHVITNRFTSIGNKSDSIIQLQDEKTSSYTQLLQRNKRFLKVSFQEKLESTILNIKLVDKTIPVQAQLPTTTTEEVIGKQPLPTVIIDLSHYKILYDSSTNLKYFIYDCTNFFPKNTEIQAELRTIFNGSTTITTDAIFCQEDPGINNNINSDIGDIAKTINDQLITSVPVTNPGINPNPQTAEELAAKGTSQARKSVPILFDCENSNGLITSVVAANYESWIALGLIPDPNN